MVLKVLFFIFYIMAATLIAGIDFEKLLRMLNPLQQIGKIIPYYD
jgi:hypothetical protein